MRVHNRAIVSEHVDGAYNVGTGSGTTINDFAKLVIKISGKNLKPIYEDVKEGEFSKLVEGRKRIPAELKKMVLDIRKTRREFDWSPRISLEEGIRREMNWASGNLDSWKVEGEIGV